MSVGYKIYGGLMSFSKMPNKSHFTKWVYLITICGFITTKRLSTWPSKSAGIPFAYIIIHKHCFLQTYVLRSLNELMSFIVQRTYCILAHINFNEFITHDCMFTRLTLVLSCAMKFESYPHDTQICSMQIESRKLFFLLADFSLLITISHCALHLQFISLVSHTTFDLVFKWNLTDPLVTNPDIELPQLDIAKNFTEDCTLEYSTGESFLLRNLLKRF